MTPFPVLYKFLHFLRIIFHYSGLLRIYYDKPKQRYYHQRSFCQYMPIVLLVLISIMHLVWRCRVEIQNELFNSLVPGSRPPRDNFELFRQFFSDIVFIITFIGACIWQDKLWCIVNEAQLAYKKLRPYLGNKWQCSFLLLALCLLLIGLLVVMCAYGIWMDWPHWADDGGAPKVLNFLMLFVHLIFATIMALHAIYHLMSAALLQTINNRIRRLKQPDKQLKVIGHVLIAQPLLKKANEYAGRYFTLYFNYFHILLIYRCWSFVVLCSTYDVNDLIQQQKSEDDRIDEADWNGQDPEAGHAELLHHAALILAWHLAMMLVLLCGAHTHQKEHQKLIDSIWEVHEYVGDESVYVDNNKASTSHTNSFVSISPTVNRRDTLNFLLNTQLSVVEFCNISLPFLVGRSKHLSGRNVLTTDSVISGFKMFLLLILFTAAVDFVHKTELNHLLVYLKEKHEND